MQADSTPPVIGELAAGLFLRRLQEQGLTTSNRHIVDYLPGDVSTALYHALMELCDTQVLVRIPGERDQDRRVETCAIAQAHVDIVPYLVLPGDQGSASTANSGTEGYASCLRDHYAVDAAKPRALIVITAEGNETQKSAQDQLADRALVTLEQLLDAVLDRAGVQQQAPLRRVAEAYSTHHEEGAPWPRVLKTFEDYVDRVSEQSPEEQGRHLPMLGAFLPDPTATFADGPPVSVLEDADQRRRKRGEGRLFDNGLLHEFLTEAFSDPIREPEHILAEVFDDQIEKAKTIAAGGIHGLASLDLETFSGMEQRRKKRQKNAFSRASLQVSSAAYHRLFGTGDETVLVVSSVDTFQVKIDLERAFNPRKEKAQLGRWNGEKEKLELTVVGASDGDDHVEYAITPPLDVPFSVWRIALTRGPRSLRDPIDVILVVVYRSSEPEIAVEEARVVSLEQQAWVCEGTQSFHLIREGETVPVAVVEAIPLDEQDTSSGASAISLEQTNLRPHIVQEGRETVETDGGDGSYLHEAMLELACTTHRRGAATTEAMRSEDHYLDAVMEIHETPLRYKVDLKTGDTREVWPHHHGANDAFRGAYAVGHLLHMRTTLHLEWNGTGWVDHEPPGEPPPAVRAYLDARSSLFEELTEIAKEKLPRFRRSPNDAAVPITMLPLHRVRDSVEGLLEAWNEACDQVMADAYTATHELLLQTDTARLLDTQGKLARLLVLPTHPWLLAAALHFQTQFAANIKSASQPTSAVQPWKFELTRADVQQMVPRSVLEEWYQSTPGEGRLLVADGAPFQLEFLPTGLQAHHSTLDYVTRVVSNKIDRYLRMHPHLRSERRTLRIGFSNPGDARHLLEGIEGWLRSVMREHAGRIRELPMAQIPNIDIFLFSSEPNEDLGAEFERFFREQVSAADQDAVTQALLARIQYRFSKEPGPQSSRDAVHICFVNGLVDASKQQGKTGPLSEWWDGGFGEGLMATQLRRTMSRGDGSLQSRRGLWLEPNVVGLRGGLARICALQRGCRDGDLSAEKALFWETPLPNLAHMQLTYRNSDWVVHLDRELSLEVFRQGAPAELPTIIEYTDQQVPDSPGYDTITATQKAKPYRDQLGEILSTADLDLTGRGDEARTSANRLLDDINALSGSWALDFLLGSIADTRTSMRLKGNVGAALAYRWIRRVELGSGSSNIVESSKGPVVPVFVSLEDLLRATPAAGLSQKDGLVYRYTNEVPDEKNQRATKWCDDLLILYLTPSQAGSPSQLFGRVVEVKFGRTARGMRDKAVAQVRNTYRLLRERLAGDSTLLDAPFRNKQLSLLIKAQLEQAVAMGAISEDVYGFINVPALSANLATGNYRVDYTIGQDGQHLAGDAILLNTDGDTEASSSIEIHDGVRVVTIARGLVEWLAFEETDAPTLAEEPPKTLPRLGEYDDAATQTGTSVRGALRAGLESGSPTPAPPGPNEGAVPDAPGVEDTERDPAPPAFAKADTGGSSAAGESLAEQEPAEVGASSSVSDANTGVAEDGDRQSLEAAAAQPVKAAPYPDDAVVDAVARLEKALVGHKIRLTSAPSARETDRGPRLLRAYVRLEPGESISSVRKSSEDIARVVGTTTSDIHITNVPERHAIGLDLPLPSLSYAVSFDEVMNHPSFLAAQRELRLGFCAGIDVTGRALWTDLSAMPHMMVAGTTGSGKTIFLRNVVLTLLLNSSPHEMVLRLSSSKPMDFRIFTRVPHAQDHEMARDASEARLLADELVAEMERRYRILDDAYCDNIIEYNNENPLAKLPFVVAVFDEYAEMVASFPEKSDRDHFEGSIGRLAQKARAAGVHLIVCMQRPDANALKGAIKANILHRFALKLPQNQDSRIILDENGAETLLGQGDLLYKDANSRLTRLQVPFLDNPTLKRHIHQIASVGSVRGIDGAAIKTCPKCGGSGPVQELFGTRKMKQQRSDGTDVMVERAQSYCRSCRSAKRD